MNSNRKSRGRKGAASVLAVAAAAILAVMFLPVSLSDVWAQATSDATEPVAEANGVAEPDPKVVVEVTRAQGRTINRARTVAGRVEPARTVDIAFQVSGQVLRLEVESGDRINEGDLIAELDRIDFELAVDRARAAFELAKSELERASSLAERGVAAESRLESARAEFAKADVALREAERRLSQTQIVAPFDAIVARTFIEEYANVTSAASVARLQDVSEMRIQISLPEELAAVARTSPDAFDIEASFPAVPGYAAPLVLRSFATDVDRTAQTYDVEFAITGDVDPRLLPGMTARVRLSTAFAEHHALSVMVPVSAVDTSSRTEPSVWVYDETSGRVTRRAVRLGLPLDNEIVVLEGLEGDELVVSGGWWRLGDNQAVTVSGP